jgi:hypothetical protein
MNLNPYPRKETMQNNQVELPEDVEGRFYEQFVEVDLGPDNDGYDAELPKWNDNFRNLSEHRDDGEYDQIDAILRFISQELSQREQVVREECIQKIHKIAVLGTMDHTAREIKLIDHIIESLTTNSEEKS